MLSGAIHLMGSLPRDAGGRGEERKGRKGGGKREREGGRERERERGGGGGGKHNLHILMAKLATMHS